MRSHLDVALGQLLARFGELLLDLVAGELLAVVGLLLRRHLLAEGLQLAAATFRSRAVLAASRSSSRYLPGEHDAQPASSSAFSSP